MRTLVILMLAFITNTSKVWGQIENKELLEAEELFVNKKFVDALPIYLNLLKYDSSDANLNFKIGVCYLNSRSQKSKAANYFEKSLSVTSRYKKNIPHYTEIDQPIIPVTAYKFLADAYLCTYNFELGIITYEKFKKLFLDSEENDPSIMEEVKWKIEMCKLGKELKAINIPLIFNAENEVKIVSYALSNDQSNRFLSSENTREKLNGDEKFFENSYPTVQANPKPISELHKISYIDTFANFYQNEATVGTSVDGQIILIYKNDNGNANLYLYSLDGNQWAVPKKVHEAVNTYGWEQNEYISVDGCFLYFTSDRAGGFGGKDIYRSKKLPNGEWGKAMNLGPLVNTPFDEEAPFIHPDGVTLYFSSNKHTSIRNFDIYTTSLSDSGTWAEPLNIGYPVNRTTKDFLYSLVADTKEVYSPIAKIYNEEANYVVTFINQKQTPFALLKGEIITFYNEIPRNVKITVTDNETREVLGTYYSNNKTGEYLFILPKRNNNIIYEAEGYLFCSENIDISETTNHYEIHKPVQIPPVIAGSKIVLNNIFFNDNEVVFRSISDVELGKLIKFLKTKKNLVVEISNYIESTENLKYNIKLSKDRADGIVKYLIEKGINKDRLISKGYGKLMRNESPNSFKEQKIIQRLELKILEIKK